MSHKKITCVFALKFTEQTALQMGFSTKIPSTAGLPYALTRTVMRSVEEMPDYHAHGNALPMLLWAYYEYVLKPHDLHDPETFASQLCKNTACKSYDEALVITTGLLKVIRPPAKFLLSVADIGEHERKGFLTSVAIFYFLEHNKFISPNEENVVDFIEIFDAEKDAPEKMRELLISTFTVVDEIIGKLAGGKNIKLEL